MARDTIGEAGGARAARRKKLAELSQVHRRLDAAQVLVLREVFVEIIEEHQARISRRLAKRGIKGAAADDVFQEILLGLFTAIVAAGFPASVPRLLHVIMKRKSSSHLRDQLGNPATVGLPSSRSEQPESAPDVERAIDLRELARRYVPRLAPALRAVIQQVVLKGLSHPEAAAVLQIPEGTVKSRLAAGEEALRAMARDFPESQRRAS